MTRICLLLVLFLSACDESEKKRPENDAHQNGDNIQALLPAGKQLVQILYWDLNKDSLQDVILITRPAVFVPESPKQKEDPARAMHIFCRSKDGSLGETVRNEYFLSGVPCEDTVRIQYFYPLIKINSDGSFGYYDFKYECGARYKSSIVFRYAEQLDDWLLDSYQHEEIPDPNGIDLSFGKDASFNKTKKEFGEIRFRDFDGKADYKIHQK